MSRGFRQRRQSSRWGLPLLAALVLFPIPSAPAAAPDAPLSLGSETVPGGAFSEVAPDWRQLSPDEGEKLAVVPPGWHVDHLGGERMMPIPGVDPGSGDRCMVFLYNAGRMDLFSEPFFLDGAGTYLFRLRTRSIVRPTPRALRAEVHLLPDGPGETVVATHWFGNDPPRGSWTNHSTRVEVPVGYGRAEIHLVKEEAATDFLVDDVSLRRMEDPAAAAAASGLAFSAPPAAAPSPYAGLRAYGGDPHVRAGLALYHVVSPGSPLATGTPEGIFASARENGLDWAAVTGVSSHIDSPRGRRWRRENGRVLKLPAGGETLDEWEHLQAVVRAANAPGSFVAFLGVEYDGGGFADEGGSGRKVILLPRDDVPQYCSPRVQNAGDCPTVRDAYRYARHFEAVMIALSPCAAAGKESTDWSRHDDPVALMSLFGGACEKGPGGFVDVNVHRGLFVGAAGGSGSRAGRAGLNDRTICWAPELTRASLLTAMKARRCYWSAAGHLDLKFEIDGAPMGSRLSAGKGVTWSVEAMGRDALPFQQVEILRNGVVVDSARCTDPARCGLSGGDPGMAAGLYYAAVHGTDGQRVAISSPILVSSSPATEAAR